MRRIRCAVPNQIQTRVPYMMHWHRTWSSRKIGETWHARCSASAGIVGDRSSLIHGGTSESLVWRTGVASVSSVSARGGAGVVTSIVGVVAATAAHAPERRSGGVIVVVITAASAAIATARHLVVWIVVMVVSSRLAGLTAEVRVGTRDVIAAGLY